MKTLQQLSLFIENKPAALSAPIQVLAEAGVNIYTLCVADTQSFGVLRLLVQDAPAAAKVLADHGFAAVLTDVVAVQVEDKPGQLARILGLFAKHEVNVEYMYAFAGFRAGQAALVFRFCDPVDALAKIGGELTLLGSSDLFV